MEDLPSQGINDQQTAVTREEAHYNVLIEQGWSERDARLMSRFEISEDEKPSSREVHPARKKMGGFAVRDYERGDSGYDPHWNVPFRELTPEQLRAGQEGLAVTRQQNDEHLLSKATTPAERSLALAKQRARKEKRARGPRA